MNRHLAYCPRGTENHFVRQGTGLSASVAAIASSIVTMACCVPPIPAKVDA
jgi:hypothetical protein